MMEIPFQVPAKYVAKMALGQAKRVGVNIVDSGSGKILGHIQETGKLAQNLSGGLNPFVQAGQLTSSVAANVQLEQVKDMLGTLQLMTGATLAVSAINLGVSVAGFVVMSKKLDKLGGQIGGLEKGLSEARRGIHQIDVRQRGRDRAAIISIMAVGDEAWSRKDAVDMWRNLADKLSGEESYYRALLEADRPHGQSIIHDDAVPLEDAIAAHEALAHLVAARMKCLMLLNELEATHHYAENFSNWLRRNFRNLTPPKVVASRLEQEAARLGKRPDDLRLEMLPKAQGFIGVLREQQEFADSMPMMIDTMIRKRIDGRVYVHQLRNEQTQDILVLEAK